MNGVPVHAPASFGQERLWFLHQLDPESLAYHVVIAIRLAGPLKTALVEECINELIARHDALRTNFRFADGRLLQLISPWRRIELTRTPWQDTLRPFDPCEGSLIRANVEQIAEQEYVLALTIHHLVTDGWSNQILLEEFVALYAAGTAGGRAELPPLPIRYADFATGQRKRSASAEAHLAYWKEQLAGRLAPLNLPTDRPRAKIQTLTGARESVTFPADLAERLKVLSRRERASLFMTLLAAFQTLLYRYTGQEDILVGSPIAGRTRTETERLVGFLVNTLVLRTDLSGEPSFREALARVRRVALEAYTHQETPFEQLVEALQPERDASRTPLFEVMFQLRNVPKKELTIPGLEVTRVALDTGTAKFDLTMELTETSQGLSCCVEYNTDLFDAGTIRRLLGHYETLLRGAIADPDCRVSRLPMLSEVERRQVLVEWNDTRREYPAECIHTQFEREVTRSPEAVALRDGERCLSYAELNARANQVAHWLRRRGVKPGGFAGLRLERSPEMVVAMLGALKAGAAYVPLAPNYPPERLAFMIEDAGIEVVLGEADEEEISRESTENPANVTSPESVAYVIYTSGSTGRPKGVAVPHRAVIRLVRQTDYLQLCPDDVVGQISNCSFDAATFEIWGALLNGARLEVIRQEVILSPVEFEAEIVARGITAMFITTALFNQMARSCPAAFRTVGTLLFGGETSNPACVAEILAKGAPRRLLHVYGPTETTTFASWHLVTEVAPDQKTIPIGRPIANTELYVLDRHLQPVPVGVAGELSIGGPGVACGYVRRPELTAEKFIAHPFTADPQARLYRTGDNVRRLADGALEFLGRLDDQVKIRGWRIEPGEIERTLTQYPGVKDAVVVVREDTPGDKRLVAYAVPHAEQAPKPEALRRFLREKLPDYMVPASVMLIDSMPLNSNGKLDRSALPRPQVPTEANGAFLGPGDPLQYQLTRIWEDLLGVKPISVHDNFFELGGHSLLAVKMADEVSKACGRKLPLGTLFAGPTIERIADTLLHNEKNFPWTPLVQVQRGDPVSKPPFVFLHGDFSSGGFYCLELARTLGADQPFYILQPHGLDGSEPPTSIEEMAADHLRTLRSFQPKGPYFLGGHCNGGVVAFEMARLLRAENQQVALVALVHSSAGRAYTGSDKIWEVLPWEPTSEELNSPDYYVRRWRRSERYKQVLWNYAPQSYPDEVTLFWPHQEPFRYDAGWGRVASKVVVHHIEGDHMTSITTHVQDLASKLGTCLRQAQARADKSLARLG